MSHIHLARQTQKALSELNFIYCIHEPGRIVSCYVGFFFFTYTEKQLGWIMSVYDDDTGTADCYIEESRGSVLRNDASI